MTGTLYGCIYNQAAAIKKAFASGHQIASHTWSHANLGNANQGKIQSEMTQLEQAMVNIFGKKPAYMRPPFLGTGPGMLQTLAGMGYSVVTDDIDSGDWNNQTPAQSQQKFEQAGPGGNGHIPLMHEVYASTVNELVPWLITWAKTNNLKLVTVGKSLPTPRARTGAETMADRVPSQPSALVMPTAPTRPAAAPPTVRRPARAVMAMAMV